MSCISKHPNKRFTLNNNFMHSYTRPAMKIYGFRKSQGPGLERPVPPTDFFMVELLQFYIGTILYAIHGKAHAGGIALLVKLDLPQRGVDEIHLE
jgi:hypothetical protein